MWDDGLKCSICCLPIRLLLLRIRSVPGHFCQNTTQPRLKSWALQWLVSLGMVPSHWQWTLKHYFILLLTGYATILQQSLEAKIQWVWSFGNGATSSMHTYATWQNSDTPCTFSKNIKVIRNCVAFWSSLSFFHDGLVTELAVVETLPSYNLVHDFANLQQQQINSSATPTTEVRTASHDFIHVTYQS